MIYRTSKSIGLKKIPLHAGKIFKSDLRDFFKMQVISFAFFIWSFQILSVSKSSGEVPSSFRLPLKVDGEGESNVPD